MKSFVRKGFVAVLKVVVLSTLKAFDGGASTTEYAPIVLGIGEQRIISIPIGAKYSLGNKKVRAARLPNYANSERSLLLRGVSSGWSDLWIFPKSGDSIKRSIRVVKWTAGSGPNLNIVRELSSLNEVEVVTFGKKFRIQGEVLTRKEAGKLDSISKLHPKAIQLRTSLSQSLLEEYLRDFRDFHSNLPEGTQVEIQNVGNQLQIYGSAPTPKLARYLADAIRTRFPLVDIDVRTFSERAQTIYFRVYLLELMRERFHEFGLQWPEVQEGAFVLTSRKLGLSLNLPIDLKVLEGDGALRVLSQPKLVVRAPGKAELFAGGEIPISEKSQYHSRITWKAFGLLLKLNVTEQIEHRVRLDIHTELSSLDSKISAGEVPGIRSNRLKTQVDASLGKPLFLCGLLHSSTREQSKGLPWLRNIPILGALFGSEAYQESKSELVAVLVPHTRPPPAPMKRFHDDYPKGPVPPPRNWVDPVEAKRLRTSQDYPWNVL